MRIEEQWIDYNGHFNMAYYNVLFDRAADEALDLVGLGPAYVENNRNTPSSPWRPTSATCASCTPADQVTIATQFLDHDHKRVHYVQQMLHATEGYIACVTEIMIMHVDMTTKEILDLSGGRSGENQDCPRRPTNRSCSTASRSQDRRFPRKEPRTVMYCNIVGAIRLPWYCNHTRNDRRPK